MALEKTNKDTYVTILSSDATFRQVVPAGTPGSEERTIEMKDGSKKVKNELVWNKMRGKITAVAFHDSDYGKLIQITITDEKGPMILSVSTSQNYGEDLMKKLPNFKLDEEVVLAPYNFNDDKGKNHRGISITQNDVKIKNFFYDEAEKKNLHGFPNPKGDTKKYSKDKWKIYFLEAREFLVEYITEKFTEGGTPAIDPNTDDADALADSLSALPDEQ